MEEQWKMIPGYENLYEASSLGRIRTAKGKTTHSRRFEKRVWKQRVLKQCVTKNKRGRYDAKVTLWKDGEEKRLLVSRLIAMTWCNGYSEEMTVNHIDGDSLNNNCMNLEWVTRAENIRYGFENGQYANSQKPLMLVINGNTHEFKSQAEASRYLGRNSGFINTCIRRNAFPAGIELKWRCS